MGIWDRLGTVIKSYLHDFEEDTEKVFKKDSQRNFHRGNRGGDPDLDAAYEELNDFLNGKAAQPEQTEKKKRPIPREVQQDFAELGLTPEASVEECKEAYKKLLKVHHPDRHTKHEGNLKKATEKTARVNAAYERLMKWLKDSG